MESPNLPRQKIPDLPLRGSMNGYTLIDPTNLNGQNYTNIFIDELQLTLRGNYYYPAVYAFIRIKDSNIVLAATESTKILKKQLLKSSHN